MTRATVRPRPVWRRYGRLTLVLSVVSLRRLVEYRADFLLGAVGFVARVGIQTLLIGVIFTLVPTIGAWTLPQVLFLFGYSLLPRGLDKLFTDNLWMVGGNLIRSGDFYRHLIRPVNPLFSVVSDRFIWPDAIGELIVGGALVVYGAGRAGVTIPPARVAAGVGLVLCGALIYASIKLLFASLAFWTTTSFASMHAVNQLSEFAGYPMGIYDTSLRSLLTWIVPFAFTAYIPARWLLFGAGHPLLWTPLVAVACAVVAYAVWLAGLRRYEMTGS